ncbi:MAG: Ig-like domain-containing protein, partial [Limisphaerales bacterium]
MKIIPKIIMADALVLALAINVNAQTQPYLSISNNSPTSVQISWTNQVGTSYRILSTPDLTVPLSLWTPLEDAFSSDTNLAVSLSSADSSNRFFAIEIPTNSGVQIFSPTNGQTVSGTIAIGVGAQIGTQIQGANLYLDDALIGVIDSGGIEFDLDTTHFTNGLHTLYVSAVDTANNETPSTPITLDFENSVLWLNADSLFQSFVPIDVQSEIFPADWAVFVADTNGTIVRTFSGTTSDGTISTNWDGNDQNGNYAPDNATYTVTVVVSSSGSGDEMIAMSGLANDSSSSDISETTNRYGVVEYEMTEPAPDPLEIYSEMLKGYAALPEAERIIYPPFSYPSADELNATITKKLSALDMFRLQHPTSTTKLNSGAVTMDAGSGGSSGSTSTTVWREA